MDLEQRLNESRTGARWISNKAVDRQDKAKRDRGTGGRAVLSACKMKLNSTGHGFNRLRPKGRRDGERRPG